MPKVSIVVPVYKVEKYLERCLNSLVNQTLSDIEIILVDDGSPDNCPKMCDEWAERDSRIKVIHKQNGGLGFARNSGIELAEGEFLGFIDSDDYVDLNMFENMYNTAVECEADFVLTGYKAIEGVLFDEGETVLECELFHEKTVFDGKDGIDELMLGVAGAAPGEYEDSRYGFSCCKNIYKTEIIKKNGFRFLSERDVISEDILFVLECIGSSERAVGIPGTHYNYCRNEGSVSKSYRSDRFEKNKFLISEMNKRLEARMPREKYGIYTDRMFQAYARVACVQEIMFGRKNNLSKAELRSRLKDICSDRELQQVLKTYPLKKLPFKQTVFAYAMRYSLAWLLELLVQLRK